MTKLHNQIDEVMVKVEGGEFAMGSEDFYPDVDRDIGPRPFLVRSFGSCSFSSGTGMSHGLDTKQVLDLGQIQVLTHAFVVERDCGHESRVPVDGDDMFRVAREAYPGHSRDSEGAGRLKEVGR